MERKAGCQREQTQYNLMMHIAALIFRWSYLNCRQECYLVCTYVLREDIVCVELKQESLGE